MVLPLNFTSDFGAYALDTFWPPTHERYGEQTAHLIYSGDYTVGGQPTCRDGIVNFNHYAGPSSLGVVEPTGPAAALANSYTLWADLTLANPGTRPNIRCLSVSADGGGLGLYFNRDSGYFGTLGQTVEHARTLLGWGGGVMSWHVELEPGGLWFCEVTVSGGLAHQSCGLTWRGGLLFGALVGQGSIGGGPIDAVLTCRAMGGTTGTRIGPPECPIPPEVEAGAGRTWAVWWP